MRELTSLQDGAKAILLDVCYKLNSSGLTYTIVGGWCPYILCSTPIPHPGTYDVDVLFESAIKINSLREVSKMFLSSGYITSAKHSFQLLRVMHVGRRKFVYNVDFMHPLETKEAPDLMIDHLDLDVYEEDLLKNTRKIKSIALPISQFIFDSHSIKYEEVISHGLFESSESVALPLISEAACVVTKALSCKNKKRPRDAFDIYLCLVQAKDQNQTVKSLTQLRSDYPVINDILTDLLSYIQKSEEFDENVIKYAQNYDVAKLGLPSKEVKDLLRKTE